MEEKIKLVTVKEMGKRFAQIRKKLDLSQAQVAEYIDVPGINQAKVSAIELGTNVISPFFLAVELFYLQHVSAEALFGTTFNIDNPHLFDKDFTLASVAKARIQLLKQQIHEDIQESLKDWDDSLDETADYLK